MSSAKLSPVIGIKRPSPDQDSQCQSSKKRRKVCDEERTKRAKDQEEVKRQKEEQKRARQKEKQQMLELQQEKKRRKHIQKEQRNMLKRAKMNKQWTNEATFQMTFYPKDPAATSSNNNQQLSLLPPEREMAAGLDALVQQYQKSSTTLATLSSTQQVPEWMDAVIPCQCSICVKTGPLPLNPLQPKQFNNILQATSYDFFICNSSLPVLQLPCDAFSRDGTYRISILHTDSSEGKRNYRVGSKTGKSRTFVRFVKVPQSEKEWLQGPFEDPSEHYVFSSLTMAAKRSRRRFANGWHWAQILLQHRDFVIRVPLMYFRVDEGGAGFNQAIHQYSPDELQLLHEASQITNSQFSKIETELSQLWQPKS